VELPLDIDQIKGFLAAEEGAALYTRARSIAAIGPALEIGSYCGKSTVYLGLACQQSNNTLYAVDHHVGSEEHQPGEMFHDPDLFDPGAQKMDSFTTFRDTLRRAGLEQSVVPVVAPSALAARHWNTGLGMIFIDGGHSLEAALTDYRSWVGHLRQHGILAIHDLFPNPADGGHAPYTIYKLAIASGLFDQLGQVGTLGLLRRL